MWETNIDRPTSYASWLEIKPTAQGCALTRSWIHDLSVYRTTLQPTELPGQGLSSFLMARTHFCPVPSQDWMHILCPLHRKSGNQMTSNQSPWAHEHCAVTSQVTQLSNSDSKWLWLLGTASPRPMQGSGTEHQPRTEHVSSRALECDRWRSWRGCCRGHCPHVPIKLMESDRHAEFYSNRSPLPTHHVFRCFITKTLRRKR